MIIIPPPTFRIESGNAYIECNVVINGKTKELFYSTTIEYAQYLSWERADAFLLAIIQYAMKRGEDIQVNAPISEKLYYNLKSQVIPLLAVALGHQEIKVNCNNLDDTIIYSEDNAAGCQKAVGTGCSLGVDSFSTILYYTSGEVPQSYHLTHLTLFNVGANGNDLKKTTESFKVDLPMASEYAKYKSLPLVTLTSNIGELYQGWDFALCHHTRNIGGVLALQKLFKKYIYASSYPVSKLRISRVDPSHFETALVPYLSTENTEVSIGMSTYSRTEKTKYIVDFPETYNRLYVCLKQVLMNDWDSYSLRNETTKRNCSSCEKCKRTMLAIDILGKRDCYSSIFDWTFYDTQRNALIGYALANGNRKGKDFYNELCELMEKEQFHIPLKARWFYCKFKLFYFLKMPKLIRF